MPKGIAKSDLPQKTCATCGRPFTWRKKWAQVWDAVKYCSDRCRDGKRPPQPLPDDPRRKMRRGGNTVASG